MASVLGDLLYYGRAVLHDDVGNTSGRLPYQYIASAITGAPPPPPAAAEAAAEP